MAKRQTPAAKPSEVGKVYLDRARAMLARWRIIVACDSGETAVRYSQDRHAEIENGLAQLLALAIEHNDRIKALESAATKFAKARKRKP